MRNGSERIAETFMRGLRLEYGSWKIICIRARMGRSADCFVRVISCPSTTMLARRSGLCSRRMVRPSVVLPEPDLPDQRPASRRAGSMMSDAVHRAHPAGV